MSTDKMRSEFEAYWTSREMVENNTRMGDECFENWCTWQAALSQSEPEVSQPEQCTNSDSWNCKYCNKTATCKAVNDPSNYGTPAMQPEVSQDHNEAVILLSAVFDAWENGIRCTDGEDGDGSFVGMAFELDDDIFNRCCSLLNRVNPPRNLSPDYEALKAENESLKLRVAELEIDANRWRYVKKTTTAVRDGSQVVQCTPDEFQASVDAAIQSTKN